MYKKFTSSSYIYTKNVQTVQNVYTVQAKKSWKLEMYVFCIYKQCANYTKPIKLTETAFLCFRYINVYTNYTKGYN